MKGTIGVAGDVHRNGFLFVGPRGKTAWSPKGWFSSALSFVADWPVVAHPWDPWPNPGEAEAAPKRRAGARKAGKRDA